jgi:hypothetical protein
LNPSTFRKSAFALTTAIALFTSPVSHAQTVLASNPPQTATLAKHCDDIKDEFGLAQFRGEYKIAADNFVAKGCAGDFPSPRKGDAYNIQRLNGAAFVLHAGGIELN